MKIPEGYPLEKAGPLMSAGIAIYDPLKRYGGLKGGKIIGVAGIGGVGTLGLKIAETLGNAAVAISDQSKLFMVEQKGACRFVNWKYEKRCWDFTFEK